MITEIFKPGEKVLVSGNEKEWIERRYLGTLLRTKFPIRTIEKGSEDIYLNTLNNVKESENYTSSRN